MPNTYWDLFCGYSALWFIFIVYGFRLLREQRELAEDIEVIRSRMADFANVSKCSSRDGFPAKESHTDKKQKAHNGS